jgi:RNA polymerase sigma-70 factor, ECF subfamily
MPRSFEEVVLPHLDAAFNYARWLTKNDADAEDVVQDAYLRALRFFPPCEVRMPARGC